jgi:hypothetical protein
VFITAGLLQEAELYDLNVRSMLQPLEITPIRESTEEKRVSSTVSKPADPAEGGAFQKQKIGPEQERLDKAFVECINKVWAFPILLFY